MIILYIDDLDTLNTKALPLLPFIVQLIQRLFDTLTVVQQVWLLSGITEINDQIKDFAKKDC